MACHKQNYEHTLFILQLQITLSLSNYTYKEMSTCIKKLQTYEANTQGRENTFMS